MSSWAAALETTRADATTPRMPHRDARSHAVLMFSTTDPPLDRGLQYTCMLGSVARPTPSPGTPDGSRADGTFRLQARVTLRPAVASCAAGATVSSPRIAPSKVLPDGNRRAIGDVTFLALWRPAWRSAPSSRGGQRRRPGASAARRSPTPTRRRRPATAVPRRAPAARRRHCWRDRWCTRARARRAPRRRA